eukprot:3129363-Amphidinium_carterae.1
MELVELSEFPTCLGQEAIWSCFALYVTRLICSIFWSFARLLLRQLLFTATFKSSPPSHNTSNHVSHI